MRRKIIRQGNNSYTLTIPISWVKEQGLKGGDEVDIAEEEAKLVLAVSPDVKKPEVSISFDLDDYNERTIRNILNQTYRKGFDRIFLKFKRRDQLEDIKDVVHKTMLGFEVTEEKQDRCTIQNIAEPSSEKYEVILRKIFFLIRQEAEDILADLKRGKVTDMAKRKENKNMIDNFTNFVRRMVINNKVGGTRNSYLLFYSTGQLSLIHHAYFYLYGFMDRQKTKRLSKDVLDLLGKANSMFDDYYNAFYKRDIEAAHKIGMMKDKLHKKDLFSLLQKKKGIENVALYHIGEIIRHIHMSSTVLFGLIESESP